jgi:hypothetical protein
MDDNATNGAKFVIKLLVGATIAACFAGLLLWMEATARRNAQPSQQPVTAPAQH